MDNHVPLLPTLTHYPPLVNTSQGRPRLVSASSGRSTGLLETRSGPAATGWLAPRRERGPAPRGAPAFVAPRGPRRRSFSAGACVQLGGVRALAGDDRRTRAGSEGERVV